MILIPSKEPIPTNYLEILTVAHVGCRKSGLILLGVLQYMDHSMLRSMIYVPPAAGNLSYGDTANPAGFLVGIRLSGPVWWSMGICSQTRQVHICLGCRAVNLTFWGSKGPGLLDGGKFGPVTLNPKCKH